MTHKIKTTNQISETNAGKKVKCRHWVRGKINHHFPSSFMPTLVPWGQSVSSHRDRRTVNTTALCTKVPASLGSRGLVFLVEGSWGRGWFCSPEIGSPTTVSQSLLPCRATPMATEGLNPTRIAWAALDGYAHIGAGLPLPVLLVPCSPPGTLPAPSPCACPFYKGQVRGHVLGWVPRDSWEGGKKMVLEDGSRTAQVLESLIGRPQHLLLSTCLHPVRSVPSCLSPCLYEEIGVLGNSPQVTPPLSY